MDDFTTLRHVLNFLQKLPGRGEGAVPAVSVATPQAVVAPVAAVAPASVVVAADSSAPVRDTAELEAFLVNFVVERTGYPAEVVDLDGDLEADLGIDSIKKAHLFSELNEFFDVGSAVTTLSMDDFTTLRHVLSFLQKLPGGVRLRCRLRVSLRRKRWSRRRLMTRMRPRGSRARPTKLALSTARNSKTKFAVSCGNMSNEAMKLSTNCPAAPLWPLRRAALGRRAR